MLGVAYMLICAPTKKMGLWHMSLFFGALIRVGFFLRNGSFSRLFRVWQPRVSQERATQRAQRIRLTLRLSLAVLKRARIARCVVFLLLLRQIGVIVRELCDSAAPSNVSKRDSGATFAVWLDLQHIGDLDPSFGRQHGSYDKLFWAESSSLQNRRNSDL
jgi:hypothetical protein